MRTTLPAALLCAACACQADADPPPAAAAADLCKVPDMLIIRANTGGAPLPLLKGDPAQPRMACSVPWATLSPDNRALPVVGCFAGKLLQLPNDSACGHGTGRLWVERRWVVINIDNKTPANTLATCEEVETSVNAATREFRPECNKPDAQHKTAAPAPPDAAPTAR